MKKFLLIFVFILIYGESFGHDLKCTSKFCKVYTAEKDCPPLADTCDHNNGEFFIGETPCGCCEICMEYLDENEYCSIGSSDSPPPIKMCGPRLTCQKNQEEYRCKKMDTPCFKEWEIYNKTIEENKPWKYKEKPICDGDGKYGPIKCNINQTCFCVDENGERIFGEAIYTESTELTMNCECSRLNKKYNDMIKYNDRIKYPSLSARCLGDGSYDVLQCLDDKCICIERESGSIFDKISYNITEIGYKNVPCFDRNMHMDWKYFHDCEEIYMNFLDEIHQTLSLNIHPIDIKIQQCQPDGWFQAIKEDSEFKFCVDKYNKKIGNYSVLKNSEDAKSMNCKCARTKDLLNRNKKEYPECCANGNFKKMQCRKIDENTAKMECYCVDENGLQIEKEWQQDNISNLSCYNERDKCH